MYPVDRTPEACYTARMLRKPISSRGFVTAVLCAQIVPLLAFPPQSFSLQSQEWWLPAFLSVLVIIALVQLLVRRTHAQWPWYLMGFAQGFSMISRLMMVLPRVTTMVDGVERFNTLTVGLYVGAIVLSAALVLFCERPDVRSALAR